MPQPNADYDAWLSAFRGRARAAGISEDAVARGLRGAGFLPGVVDWVVVELRTGTAASTKIERQAALVLSDGNIVSFEDQTIAPNFNNIDPGQAYYVVIYHRNHFPVMTASAPSSTTC